jgi:hypothetical protein
MSQSAIIRTAHGPRCFNRAPPMRSVLLTADEVADLAALRMRQAREAECEGRHDTAQRLYARAVALREGAR